MEDTKQIIKDGKVYFFDWKDNEIQITPTSEHPNRIEMLETFDFVRVE